MSRIGLPFSSKVYFSTILLTFVLWYANITLHCKRLPWVAVGPYIQWILDNATLKYQNSQREIDTLYVYDMHGVAMSNDLGGLSVKRKHDSCQKNIRTEAKLRKVYTVVITHRSTVLWAPLGIFSSYYFMWDVPSGRKWFWLSISSCPL